MTIKLFGDVSLESGIRENLTSVNSCWTAWIDICGLGWETDETVYIADFLTLEDAEEALEDEMLSALKEIADNCQKGLARRRDGR